MDRCELMMRLGIKKIKGIRAVKEEKRATKQSVANLHFRKMNYLYSVSFDQYGSSEGNEGIDLL
jgi:hypothetical protein